MNKLQNLRANLINLQNKITETEKGINDRRDYKKDLVDKLGQEEKVLSLLSDSYIAIQSLIKQQIEIPISNFIQPFFVSQKGAKFTIEINESRGYPCFDIAIETAGSKFTDLTFDFGGGVNEVISFLLRVFMLKLSGNNATLLMDEPFTAVSKKGGFREAVANVVKQLAETLNLQIFIITHEPWLIEEKGFNKIEIGE